MKAALILSVLLNLVLLGGLSFLIANGPKETMAKAPIPPAPKAATPADVTPAKPEILVVQPQPFRWSQLKSGHDYRRFIANLRASGCPESTIRDIVQGNVSRGFAWERSRLGIDDSTDGPWSKTSEIALVADLLQMPATTETVATAGTGATSVNSSQSQAIQSPGSAIPADISPSGQTVGASQNVQPSGYVPAYYGGNGAVANSGTVPTSGSQTQPALADSSGQNHNSTGWTPQDNSPNSFSPSDSPDQNSGQNNSSWDSGPPVGPPDPLGPNDPYAKSAQDIQQKELDDYYTWFAPNAAANLDGSTLGINPMDAGN